MTTRNQLTLPEQQALERMDAKRDDLLSQRSENTVAIVYLLHEVPGPYWVYPTITEAENAAAVMKQQHPERRYAIHGVEFVGHPNDIHVRLRSKGGQT